MPTPIHRTILFLASVLLCASAPLRETKASATDAFATALQPAFEKHCVQCHGKDDKVKGKVNLLELGSLTDLTPTRNFSKT